MATIKLTTKNALYGAKGVEYQSLRANFDGPQNGTGWLHGTPRFEAVVKIPGTDIQGKVTVGDTSMLWRRHGNGEGFDKLFAFLSTRLDQDVKIEVVKSE